jgi:outer membrane lipopolysaccharide assembly protein LptE/RlpB
MRVHLACLLSLVVFCGGCGYQQLKYGQALGDLRRVSVRTLSNDSDEPGIEMMVSEALRREFLRRGAVSLSADAGDADLSLRGRVLRIRTQPRSFSAAVLALEYSVTLEIDIRVTDRDGEPVAIDGRSLRETEIYLASADLEAGRKNRDEALRRVSTLLAARVYDAIYVAVSE